MATTASFTSTYAGDAVKSYILKAIAYGETWSTAGMSIEEGVKYKRTIKRLDSATLVKAASCAFDATGTLTIDERLLEPKGIEINSELCFEDIYPLFDSAEMAAGKHNDQVPQEVIDAIVARHITELGVAIESMTWQGDTAGATGGVLDLIDGFEKTLTASGTPVVGVLGGPTAANVIAEMNKVIDAVDAGVLAKGRDNLVLFVSHATGMFYEQALAAQGVNRNGSADVSGLYGIEVRSISGLSNSTYMALGERSNFYLGTDLFSDDNTVKTIDMRETTGDDNVRFIMKFGIDVNIGWPVEVIFYVPTLV